MGVLKTLLWPFFQGDAALPTKPLTPPPPVVAQQTGTIFQPATMPRPALIAGVPVPGIDRPVVDTDFDAPDFPPLVSNVDRQKIFGRFDYEPDPLQGNEEHIHIIGSWVADNIRFVPIPQMKGVAGAEIGHKANGKPVPGMQFHRLGVVQLQGMWEDWERAGLLPLIKNFDGSFVTRFVRGSSSNLSNHCFGNAFDINYNWNTLGAEPAQLGKVGSVRALIPIASHWGFYWGGFYHNRKDGMHFEIAKVMP